MAAQATATTPIKQKRFLAVTAVGMFLAQSVHLMLTPLLVELSGDFNISVAVAGQLTAVTFAAWAVSVLSVGPISDSYGRRPVAVIGFGLLGASVLVSSLAPNFAVLFVLRIITGLTGGMIPPNSMAAVADVLPPSKRARAFGLLMAFASLSSVVGLPMVAVLAGLGGWRVPFVAMGGMLLTCAVLQWSWFPRSQDTGPRTFSFLSRYKQMAGIGLFRATLAANLLQRMAYYGTMAYLAAFLINEHGLSVGKTALPLAIVGVGVVIGSSMAGTITAMNKRYLAVAVFAMAGGLASLVLFSLDMPVWATVVVALAGTTVINVGWPTFLAISTEISGSSQATAVGMLGSSNQMGGLGGAALGGAVLALGGFSAVGFFCLAVTAISALILLFGMGKRRPAD